MIKNLQTRQISYDQLIVYSIEWKLLDPLQRDLCVLKFSKFSHLVFSLKYAAW